MTKRVGLIGGRGHTGREILRRIAGRDDLELVYSSSREFDGRPIRDIAPEYTGGLNFQALSAADAAGIPADAIILALPNGAAAGFVAALEEAQPEAILIDLSADYRFDEHWAYGLPEIHGRDPLRTSRRISNPGCYATAGQLALAPVRAELAGSAHVFGVSGYSGAGTTPSRKNDRDALRDNLMPYALSGHIHEREMSRHLGVDIRFTPHVAAFFSGIVATVHADLSRPVERAELIDQYRTYYAGEALVEVREDIPEVRDGSGQPGAVIGGFSLDNDGRRLVIVSVLDNLLKGAAVQAMQNLTLALGLPEHRS